MPTGCSTVILQKNLVLHLNIRKYTMKLVNYFSGFVLVTITLFLTSCSSPKEKLSAEIREKEKKLYSDSSSVPSAAEAKEIIALYTRYATEFADDTISASYLFKAGDISSKINETHQAIELFGRMIEKYPDHASTPYALFLQGFIYENQMGDPMKAKPYYEAFLKKYPDHPIAGDVSFSLENLGKTPEQLIREFEARMQQKDSAAADSAQATTR